MEQATQAELILFSTQSLLLAVDEEPVGQILLGLVAAPVGAEVVMQEDRQVVAVTLQAFLLPKAIMAVLVLQLGQPAAVVAEAEVQPILGPTLVDILVAMVATALFRPYQVLL